MVPLASVSVASPSQLVIAGRPEHDGGLVPVEMEVHLARGADRENIWSTAQIEELIACRFRYAPASPPASEHERQQDVVNIPSP